MPAVFDRRYVKRLDGPNVKKGKNKTGPRRPGARRHADVQDRTTASSRLVMVWCGSTEVYLTEIAGARERRGLREGARGERRRRFRRA